MQRCSSFSQISQQNQQDAQTPNRTTGKQQIPFSFLSVGIDCYCTDKIAHPEALTASKDCRTPCTACKNTQRCNTTANGNRTEFCGGGGHVAAYRFKCSGAPVPRPSRLAFTSKSAGSAAASERKSR